MSPYKKQQHKKRKNLFRKLHRWIGFTSAAFLINLAVTGILLNHSDDLELQKKYIATPWLVNWYGFKAPKFFTCIKNSDISLNICQVGKSIYKDESLLIQTNSTLIGLVNLDNLIYIATEHEIFIFTSDFDLVEILDSISGIPNSLDKIGFVLIDGGKYLSIKSEHKVLFFESENNVWKDTDRTFQTPLNPVFLQTKNVEELQSNYLKNKISYLKFIQDLHSGRLLGLPGKLITDLVGLIVLLLVISGFITWKKRKSHNRTI